MDELMDRDRAEPQRKARRGHALIRYRNGNHEMSIKVLKTLGITLGITAAGLAVIGAIKKPGSVYKNEPDQQNPMEGKRVRFVEDDSEPANADGKCGHLEANLEAVGETQTQHAGIYEKYV